jgi:DNA-directed RNA polymerase II subunit RPB2
MPAKHTCTRMTIGMMVEILTGKKMCVTSSLNSIPMSEVFDINNPNHAKQDDVPLSDGAEYSTFKSDGDSTPFGRNFSLDKICQELKALGYNEFGDERMINGMTGEMMPSLIFYGPCYYQRLKHMVVNKFHSRARGGRTALTRAPKEGRKQGGGLRCGHMERDALLAHGGSGFVRDRLMEQSDDYKMWVCSTCGLQAKVVKSTNVGSAPDDQYASKECTVCKSTDVRQIRIPYATKLLIQELGGMNVVVRVLPTPYNSGV